MRAIASFLTSLIFAVWLIVIATISIQNIQPVSLKFLTFQSVEFPFGIVLTFSVVTGLLLGGVLPTLPGKFQRSKSKKSR
ncbi:MULTISPECIES: LapA family protein [Spirulina sp. CCY15215]|nr:LapA family protein [Spirulina major]